MTDHPGPYGAEQPRGNVAAAQALGQSVWLDNLSRRLIRSGRLDRLRDLGVTGITSNPTIFQKAVAGSNDYQEGLRELVTRGRAPHDILWDLMVEDVVAAADSFRPVFDSHGGRDGFVSIEVSPTVAHSTEATVAMARDLRRRCNRPNVMVKIPATREGVAAIQTMISEGANINVTLIFSVQRYQEVVEAFLSGLETLARNGGDVAQVNSVASFFVSRVDTKVDALIDTRLAGALSDDAKRGLESIRGTIGIANSKMAYQRFLALHSGARWEALAGAGAVPQRCLWASTSVKDPRYPDTLYVDNLIGAATVDTMPEATLEALVDHGSVRARLGANLDGARAHLDQLQRCGFSLDQVTDDLEREGVAAFEKSYQELGHTLTEAVGELVGHSDGSVSDG
ncbi:MAG: transaldolase [Candidatus Dormibacteria bacterium]